MNENKIKNKNKAIILVIIMLIILTLSTTIAFFTASSTNNTENIVATNNIQLNFTDNKNLMKGELIPVSYEDAKSFFVSEETCIYTDNSGNKFNACSIYEFSIENTSEVAQELVISLNPTVNTFTNLNYILYEVEGENNTELTTKELTKNSLTSVNLLNGNELKENITAESKTITLKSNETATYKILFFIKNIGEDQTAMDAGKNFGAGVRVDSITTGQYITKTFGTSCWTLDEADNSKLTAFSGINEDGTINESCTGYIQQDEAGLYSINVPSNVGGNKITTLGNDLFNIMESMDENGKPILNNYVNIEKIDIADGITAIEDGCGDTDNCDVTGTFMGIGFDYETFQVIENRELVINLPDSVTNIGSAAFFYSALKEISIPSSVESIGEFAFSNNSNLTKVLFMGAEDNTSKLTNIGNYAFSGCNLTYGESNPLEIPSSVTLIAKGSFSGNSNLTHIRYLGSYSATDWYNSSVTTIIKE